MKLTKVLLLAGSVLPALLIPQIASAAICAVPAEVIARTKELEAKVTAQIVKSEGLLITEELRQRQMLLGALKVVTRQESGSGQQSATVIAKSREAAANANTTQRLAYKIADAKERYSAIGYDSCTLLTKSQSFYQANQAEQGKTQGLASGTKFRPGEWGSPRPWAALATGSGATDAEALFSGNSGEAQRYIDMVAGPPLEKPNMSPAETQVATLRKHGDDVKRSLAVQIMSSIAAQNDSGGARAKLQAMVNHWTGDDGGEKWANAMADQPLRGALLDAVRMEAANVSLLAYQVKETARTELALSGYALARINDIITGKDRVIAPVEVRDGGSQRAALNQ
nr:hypothetical protein [Nitrosomonas nitrosa]